MSCSRGEAKRAVSKALKANAALEYLRDEHGEHEVTEIVLNDYIRLSLTALHAAQEALGLSVNGQGPESEPEPAGPAPAPLPAPEEPWMTATRASKQFNIPRDELYRLAESGEVQAQKLGRGYRFKESAITFWLNRLSSDQNIDRARQEMTKIIEQQE